MKKYILLLIAFLIIPGCTTSKYERVDQDGNPCNKAPKWVKKLPSKKGHIMAVGFAMADTHPEYSANAAKKKARLELSKTIETKMNVDSQIIDEYIRKKGLDAETTNRTTVIRDIVKEKTTRIVKGSKIEAVYRDNCNAMGRGEDAHFALASLPKP